MKVRIHFFVINITLICFFSSIEAASLVSIIKLESLMNYHERVLEGSTSNDDLIASQQYRGYILGVVDALYNTDTTSFNIPKNLSAQQAIATVSEYIKREGQSGKLDRDRDIWDLVPGYAAIFSALQTSYPGNQNPPVDFERKLFFSGNDLVPLMRAHDRVLSGVGSKNDILEAAKLEGYVSGSFDNTVHQEKLPKSVTITQVLAVTKKFVYDRPQLWHMSARSLILVALGVTFSENVK